MAVPGYLALRDGSSPIIVVAPHGGSRSRAIRPGDSVNDLHTSEIAWTLAEKLDAHAIVNHALDRNDIDLNRIGHLSSRAPEALALLLAAIEHEVAGGRVPLVLFVHGWNMVTACCDIGIGLRRRDGKVSGRYPTLSVDRYEGAIGAIERELSARGLLADIGRRYTASGRDNAAQLFSGRHRSSDDRLVARIGELAACGRVDAAQLELGIPLRWPGPRRDALIDGLVAALGNMPDTPLPVSTSGGVARDDWDLPSAPEEENAARLEPGYALQAVLDIDGNVATFCGVEATAPHSMVVRFSLVSTDGSMMLLVAEGSWSGEHGRYDLEGFSWHAEEDGRRISIRLRGPMIRYETHDAYLDLERGLAGSSLVDGDVELTFDATSSEHGVLRGSVRAGEVRCEVDTVAFFDRGGRRAEQARDRMRVLVARDAASVVIVRGDDGVLTLDRDASPLGTIASTNGFSQANIVARVPVWRPLGEGRASRWTFGIVRCRFDGETGERPGLFDSLEIFSRPARE